MSTETKNRSHRADWWSKITNTASYVQEHPLVWLAPAIALLFLFRLYPLIEVVRMSFTNISLIQPAYEYVGFNSYIAVITSTAFRTMARTTAIFVGASVIAQLTLGMILALAINYGVKKHIYGSVSIRIAVLSAWVIPGIVIGILWKIMLIETNYGLVNYILVQLGFNVVSFFSDPQMALFSTIMANTWRGTAFSMIMLYAGLQQVPQQLYHAAKVDGAGPIARFRHVTLPQIKPVVFINIVLITIYTVNTFDMIMSLTGGGPGRATEVLSLFMYFLGFEQFQLGRAAAVAVIMLGVNVVMTLVYVRYLLSEEEI